MGRAVKTAYVVIMLFAVVVVVGGKIPAVGRFLLARDSVAQSLGDLYQMSQLDRFREEIPVWPAAPAVKSEQAEILTLGDSFFNTTMGSDLFAVSLAKRTGLPVCNLQSETFPEPQTFPLSFLDSIGYRPGKKRVLILESVERNILARSSHYNAAGGSSQGLLNVAYGKLLDNTDLAYFFKNNVLVYPFGKWLKNVKFSCFNVVDRAIGAYSLNPDMLFYAEDLEFARQEKTAAMLEESAENIATLSAQLKKRYDLELVYVMIPNKYSVYHGFVQDGYRYDDFIPRLSRKLTGLGVRNVDLYSIYSRHNKPGMPLLYYTSDTHFTPLGKRLLVEACAGAVAAARNGR